MAFKPNSASVTLRSLSKMLLRCVDVFTKRIKNISDFVTGVSQGIIICVRFIYPLLINEVGKECGSYQYNWH